MFWSSGFHRLVQLHLSADPNLWVDQVCDRAQQPRSICRQYNATFVQVRFLPTMAWNNNGTQYMEQKLNFPPKFNACNFTFTCSPPLPPFLISLFWPTPGSRQGIRYLVIREFSGTLVSERCSAWLLCCQMTPQQKDPGARFGSSRARWLRC